MKTIQRIFCSLILILSFATPSFAHEEHSSLWTIIFYHYGFALILLFLFLMAISIVIMVALNTKLRQSKAHVEEELRERARIENELRESETQYRELVQNANSIILRIDGEGKITFFNKFAQNFFGYDKDEILGQSVFDTIIPPTDQEGRDMTAIIPDIIKNIDNYKYNENENVKRSGQRVWIAWTNRVIRVEKTGREEILCVGTDVTKRRQMTKELKKALNELKDLEQIINRSNAIVFRWKAEKNWPVEFVSDNIERFGYKPEDFYSDKVLFEDIVYPDDLKGISEEIERYSENRQDEFHQEYRILTKHQKIRWVEVYTWIRYDAKGKRSHYQGVIFDNTESHLAQEKIEEAVQMKSEFISIVSHELRTPLAAIRESINIVAEEGIKNVTPEQMEFLDVARRNVDRLAMLINDVLDYQRLEAGRMQMHFETVDITAIIKEIQKTMSTVAKQKGLDLAFDLGHDLPKVQIDQLRIIQVLNNLVNNAIKFTTQGSVVIKAEKKKNELYLSVQDTGKGIKQEDIHKLFHSFSQIEKGAERMTGSTGLGLAISKRIVQEHGGRMWCESAPGHGSTFFFVLPGRI